MMRNKWAVSAVSIALLFPGLQASAMEVVKGENAGLDIGGRLQVLGYGQYMPDEVDRKPVRLGLFAQQTRMLMNGHLGDYRMHFQMGFGGEDEVKDNYSTSSGSYNSALGLLDFNVDIPIFGERLYVKAGQFKVNWGREQLIDDGALYFTTRSINDLAFRYGRDVGVAAVLAMEGLNGAIGVYTGGGRDIPERFLPEDLGIPLLVARLGFNTAGSDMYASHDAGVFELKKQEASVYLNGAYMQDSLVGHSSVLKVKPSEKSLMINPNWNPYLTGKGELFQYGIDGQLRHPMGESILTAEAELNSGIYTSEAGSIRVSGGRAVVAMARKPFEAAIRYAFIAPSDAFAISGKQITGSEWIHELTPSVTYWHNANSRLMLEVPLSINAPMANEKGLGQYSLMEMPQETTVLKTGGSVSRKFSPEVRLMYQFQF